MALQGDLTTMPVRQLLTWLAQQRATGQLSLSQGMVVRRFHLREGKVVLASSSEEPNLLGRLLVDRGLLPASELARVLAEPGARRRSRLGKALVEAGLVSEETLGGVLADKAERLVTGALTWSDGSFYFDDTASARRQAAHMPAVDLAALLDRVADRLVDHAGAVPVTDEDVIDVQPLPGRKSARPTQGRRRRPGAVGGQAA